MPNWLSLVVMNLGQPAQTWSSERQLRLNMKTFSYKAPWSHRTPQSPLTRALERITKRSWMPSNTPKKNLPFRYLFLFCGNQSGPDYPIFWFLYLETQTGEFGLRNSLRWIFALGRANRAKVRDYQTARAMGCTHIQGPRLAFWSLERRSSTW